MSFASYVRDEEAKQRAAGHSLPPLRTAAHRAWLREASRRFLTAAPPSPHPTDAGRWVEEIRTAPQVELPTADRIAEGDVEDVHALLLLSAKHPDDEQIGLALRQMRPRVEELRAAGIVGYMRNSLVHIRYELFFLRRLLQRWAAQSDDNRKAVLLSTQELCEALPLAPVKALWDAIACMSKNAEHLSNPDATALIAAVDVALTQLPPVANFVAEEERKREEPPAKVRRLDLIGVRVPNHVVPQVASRVTFLPPPRVESGERRKTTAVHPWPCRSVYHDMYAPPERHASSECRYCSCCHLLAYLFGGETSRCAWNHFPTERKIATHLRGFPIYALAIKRMEALQRGETLPPLEIPLTRPS